MQKQDYQFFLNRAMKSINDCLGAEFTAESMILQCFHTENKEKVFKEFCSTYFPYRLADDYKTNDYFEFRASAFVGKDNGGIDGIMLRTDIDYSPNELHHVFLHELTHIFCVHHELDGQNFYDRYCVDYAPTKEEDGIINAGYAVWREMIAEVIAIECDEAYPIQPLKRKLPYIQDYMDHIDPLSGKLFMSMILTEIMTSSEFEMSETWEEARPYIQEICLLKGSCFLDLCQIVFVQLRTRLLKIDIDFISSVGWLYLNILETVMMKKFGNSLK